MTDTSDLVERLRFKSNMILIGEKIAFGSECEVMDEAATALTAKDKEIEALRGERDHYLSSWEESRKYLAIETNHAMQAEARAETAERRVAELFVERDALQMAFESSLLNTETAERERDEARAALKLGLDLISEEKGWGTYPRMEVFKDAVRAVIEQGE